MELPGGRVAGASRRRRLLVGGQDSIDGSTRNPLTERDLVDRARSGSRKAFETLFRTHRQQVYAIALRLTDDPGVAEEVVLDAFVSAWSGLAEFRGDSRFSTWVSSIAVNHSRQARRTRSRRRRRFDSLDRSGAGARAVDGSAPRIEERIDVERAIAGLPAGAREALLLRHVHGLSCAETAAVLNVSVGTVKSQTSRACALLRERLHHD